MILVKGTLELQSGVLQNTGGKHIVLVDRGTLDVNGGYIVGGGSDGTPGGGIYVDNGTVNTMGGVIAATPWQFRRRYLLSKRNAEHLRRCGDGQLGQQWP